MRLSGPKINHLAHLVAGQLADTYAVRCLRDKNDIRLRIKIIITDELRLDDEIDLVVRRMLNSLSKAPPEGSREWEVLYEKYYEEESNRRRHDRRDGIRRIR